MLSRQQILLVVCISAAVAFILLLRHFSTLPETLVFILGGGVPFEIYLIISVFILPYRD
jgi:hypothetical protein